MYGEWLALTATVSYLSALNYGIQNYANNQMTIHYNRGELNETKAVQSSALWLISILVVALSAAASTILAMPVGRWLGLRFVSSSAASLTAFLMVMQLAIGFLLGFFANSFMVIGQAHRGQLWINGQRLTCAFALAAAVWERASFPVLAATQCITVFAFMLAAVADLRLKAPFLSPSLRHGSVRQILSQLKPSGHFMLISVTTFLVWQGPLLIIQKILGPASVAVFALSRTVFSMSRQLLAVASYSLGQDITHLIGQRNWLQLRRLYELSEKVVLFLTPISTIGTLLLCPMLFSIWLHQRSIYDPAMCMLLAIASAVIGIKEHKVQFQWSSNEHERFARFTLVAYTVMLAASAFSIRRTGINSFVCIWIVTEVVIAIYVVYQNLELFPPDLHVSVRPMFQLFWVLAIAFPLVVWPVWHSAHWGIFKVLAVAVVATGALAVVDYFSFGLGEVRAVVMGKIRRRLATSER